MADPFYNSEDILKELQQWGQMSRQPGAVQPRAVGVANLNTPVENPYAMPVYDVAQPTGRQAAQQFGTGIETIPGMGGINAALSRLESAERRQQKADALAEKKALPSTIEQLTAERLGVSTEEAKQAAAMPIGGAAQKQLRIDPAAKWPDVVASENWKQLPFEEQAVQRKMWVDQNVAELKARMEQTLGKTLKDTDPILVNQRKVFDAQTRISLGVSPKEKDSVFDTDYFDRAVKTIKDTYQGIRLAYGDEATRADAQRQLKANDADWQANMSATTADNLKKAALWRSDMLDATEKATGKRELTAAQEAEIAAKVFNLDKVGTILGNLPTSLVSLGVSAGAGVGVGALTGGVGAAPAAAAAGAAVNVPLTVADVSGGIVDRVNNARAEDLAKSPQFQALLQSNGGNVEAAKTAFINQLVDAAKPLASGVGAASGALEGIVGAGKLLGVGKTALAKQATGIIDQVFTKAGLASIGRDTALKNFASTIGKPAAGLVSRKTASGVVGEAIQEFGEEGAGQIAQNIALRRGELDVGLTEGAIEAGVSGALAGTGTAAGVAGGKAVYGTTLGPKRDSNGDLLLVEKDGQLSRTSNSKLAAGSNLAIDQNSGLMRLVDANEGADPEANALIAYRNNANVFGRVAAAQGMQVETASLAGAALAASMFGDQVSAVATPTITTPSGITVGFNVNGNGTITPVLPANATPDVQAFAAQQAQLVNDAVQPVLEQVNSFWNRTNGVAPAPGALTATQPVVSTQQPTAQPVVSTQQPAPQPAGVNVPTAGQDRIAAARAAMGEAFGAQRQPAAPAAQPTGGQDAVQVGSTTQIPVGNGAQVGQEVGQGNAQGQEVAGQGQAQAQAQVTPERIAILAPVIDRQLRNARSIGVSAEEAQDVISRGAIDGLGGLTTAELEYVGREVASRIRLGVPAGAPTTPQSNESIARSLPRGLDNDGRRQAIEQWVAQNAPGLSEQAAANLRLAVGREYRRLGLDAPEANSGIAPAPAPAETGLTADQIAGLGELDFRIQQLRSNPNLSLFETTTQIGDLLAREMRDNSPTYQAYAEDRVQDFENLDWARNQIGLNIQAGAVPTQAWAQATLNQGGDPRAALNAIVADPAAGQVNRDAAALVLQLYETTGVPLPAVSNRDDSGQRPMGYYSPTDHRIDFNPRTTAATVPHEHLHALTVRGMNRIAANARNGDQQAQDLQALISYLYSKMPRGRYMAQNEKEMLAELLRPEQLAFAYSNDISLDDMPANARRALGDMTTATGQAEAMNLRIAIRRMFESVLQMLGATRQDVPQLSEVLMRVATEASYQTAEAMNVPSRRGEAAPAAQTPNTNEIVSRMPAGLNLQQAQSEARNIITRVYPQLTPAEITNLVANSVAVYTTEQMPVSGAPAAQAPAISPSIEARTTITAQANTAVENGVSENAFGNTIARMISGGMLPGVDTANSQDAVRFATQEFRRLNAISRGAPAPAAQTATVQETEDRANAAWQIVQQQNPSMIREGYVNRMLRNAASTIASPVEVLREAASMLRNEATELEADGDTEDAQMYRATANTFLDAIAAPTPAAQPSAAAQPARNLDAPMPRDLTRSSPKFGQHPVQFARAIDKASWIARAGQVRRSTRDADFVAFVQSVTGWTERQVRQHGQAVHREIGLLARQAGAPDTTIRLDVVEPTVAGTTTAATPAATPPTVMPGMPAPFSGSDNNRSNVRGVSTGVSQQEFTDRSARLANLVVANGGSRSDRYLEGATLPTTVINGLGTDPQAADTAVAEFITNALNINLSPNAILGSPNVGDTIQTSSTVEPNGPRGGITYTVREIRPDGTLRVESNSQAGTFRDLRVQELQNMASRGTRWEINGRAFQIPSQPGAPAAAATEGDRQVAFDNFVRDYMAAANTKLQAALAGATTLEQKRAAGKNTLGITAPTGSYLAEVRYSGGRVYYDYKDTNDRATRSSSGSRDFPRGQVHFTTASFNEGSGEGTPFYDAVYGAAVHSGLPVQVTGLLDANKRRMPINRLRAMLRWGNYFNDMNRVQKVLGLERQLFPFVGTNAVDGRAQLDGLFEHVEASLTSGLNPQGGRPIGYDFATNQVVVGPNRTPVPNLAAWLRTQSANITGQTQAFVNRPTEDSVRLIGIMRELARAQDSQAAQQMLDQLNAAATSRLFDMPAQEPAAAPVDGLFGERADEAPVGAEPGTLLKPEPPTTPSGGGGQPAPQPRVGASLLRQPTGTPAATTQPAARAPGATLAALGAGQSAAAATVGRGITQALSSTGTTNQRIERAKPYFAQLGDRATEYFVDALIPMVRWVQSLPVAPGLKQAVLGAMYRAPNIRDNILDRAQKDYGGEQLNEAIAAMLTRRKQTDRNATAENVVRDAGFWLTAKYSLVKNARMLKAAEDAMLEAELQLQTAQQNNASAREIAELQAQYDAARNAFEDRQHALRQPEGTNVHMGLARGANPAEQVGLAGGMNDAQAMAFMRRAEQMFGKPALEQMAKHVYSLNAFRLATDIESGRTDVDAAIRFSPEIATAEQEMRNLVAVTGNPASSQTQIEAARKAVIDKLIASGSTYVPTTGTPEGGFEGDVLGTGYRAPNVAREKRLGGRATSLADDGITASLGGMMRSASAAGWNDFTKLIEQAYNDMTPEQRQAVGMKKVDITALQRLGDNVVIRNQPDGSAVGYSIKDGKELGALRRENVEEKAQLFRTLEKPTQWFAKFATRWNLPFGPVNMIRDVWERSENMRARNYTTAAGKPVDSAKAASRMLQIARDPNVVKEMFSAYWAQVKGKPLPNSKYAVALREFEDLGGGGSKYGTSLSRDRKDLVKEIDRAQSNNKITKGWRFLEKYVDFYNDALDSVAPVSAYMALRDQGMSKESAAAAALDLMNFRKTGAVMPVVRMLYAFAQPTATSAANLINTLKTPVGKKRFLGYLTAFVAWQAMAAMMAGEDEETGKNAYDALDDYAKEKSIPLPLPNGDFLKLPLGFGLPLLANQTAMFFRDMQRDDLSTAEAVDNLALRYAKQIAPLNESKIQNDAAKFFLQTFAPTAYMPLFNVALNRTGLGGEIVKEAFLDKDRYKSEQGSPTTADFYKDVAQITRNTTGIDFAPEQIKELMNGVSLGLLRNIRDILVDNPWKEELGRPTKTPVVSSFYADTSNAILGDTARFEREALGISKERDVNPEMELTPREEQIAQLYERWSEVEKRSRARAAALTRAGIEKGIGAPERQALREERQAAQAEIIRQFNQIGR